MINILKSICVLMAGIGMQVSQEKKDDINREIANK